MTRDELLGHIEFESEEERQEADCYIYVKGIALHAKILKYLKFDVRENERIKWSLLAEKLSQDKLLRDKLYIYLATLEEYIRAYIANKYENNIQQPFWINGVGHRNKIKDNITMGMALF
ncbi:MAG: hypothetical protein NC114_11535, partial [Ruminococcus flavefaciens]|nr:hypothetical protein [Ruminococcus flavefaciens]